MLATLQLHPEAECPSLSRIDVSIERSAREWTLRFLLTGQISALKVPDKTAARRTDGLWRHTCCEWFVAEDEAYCEFNFSPSTEWAAYRFTGYRVGRSDLAARAPVIDVRVGEILLELTARIELNVQAHAKLRYGASAVIEEKSGNKSYWALAHPPGKPDFHRASGFVAWVD